MIQVARIGLSRAADEAVLRAAERRGCVLVTRDRDYGSLVFVNALGAGVVYLRMLPSTQDAVHRELGKVLHTYSEEGLKRTFVVVEADGHRIRRPSQV